MGHRWRGQLDSKPRDHCLHVCTVFYPCAKLQPSGGLRSQLEGLAPYLSSGNHGWVWSGQIPGLCFLRHREGRGQSGGPWWMVSESWRRNGKTAVFLQKVRKKKPPVTLNYPSWWIGVTGSLAEIWSVICKPSSNCVLPKRALSVLFSKQRVCLLPSVLINCFCFYSKFLVILNIVISTLSN
jgi:hypothetical protein